MAETKSYWTAYRTATLIASPIVATCFWAAFRNWKSWVFVIQTAAISALVFFALWGITFVVSLIRTPGLLDKERDLLEEERDKDQQNNALAQVEEIKRLEDEAKAEAERRKVKCSFTVRVDKSETTPVRIRYAPFGSIMYPEMLVPTINLVVYNEGGEPLTMTGYRLQKTSPENDAPISVLHHRLVEREANIDITEGLFQAVAGSPPDDTKLFNNSKFCAVVEYKKDSGYDETEFNLFDLMVALRGDKRVSVSVSPVYRN